jgi:hypothetical protein
MNGDERENVEGLSKPFAHRLAAMIEALGW